MRLPRPARPPPARCAHDVVQEMRPKAGTTHYGGNSPNKGFWRAHLRYAGQSGFSWCVFWLRDYRQQPSLADARPSNWESVLWHNFATRLRWHLHATKCRAGSVKASVCTDAKQPTWGQRMNPRFRELILGGELTPVSKMSGAFLRRKVISIPFAYYQSSLVVEHLPNALD